MGSFVFFPLHIQYKIIEHETIIEMWGRTPEGRQLCVQYTQFKPYFLVQAKTKRRDSLKKELESLSIESQDRRLAVQQVEEIEKIVGKDPIKVLKVTVELPPDVRKFREELSDHKDIEEIFDADIPFIKRFLADMDIIPMGAILIDGEDIDSHYKVPVVDAKKITAQDDEYLTDLNVLAFDIETYVAYDEGVNPQKNPIIMVAFAGKKYRKVVTWQEFKTSDKSIEFVEDEAALITRVQEIIEEERPDVLLGYFSDGFDLPYLRERARIHGLRLHLGLDNSGISMRTGANPNARLGGIVHLDIFKFIRGTMRVMLDTTEYSLDAVSEELLGEKKIEVKITEIGKVWDSGDRDRLEQFCQYNLKDADLTYRLYESLAENLFELVKIVGQTIFDTSRMPYSQLVEWHLIKEAALQNRVTPLSPDRKQIGERRRESFQGAFVVKPEPGLHKDISVYDFRSLYPSIISAHNISPETLRCSCCKTAFVPHDDKTWFCTKDKGFIAGVIEDLITRRARVKEMISGAKKGEKKLLDARQNSLKLVANAMYGYLAFSGARWYSMEAARGITAYGRHYIHDVIERAKGKGFKVVYGDTDSVFLSLRGTDREELDRFVEEVNSKLPGLMELEFEGFYPVGIFVSTKGDRGQGAKKKYALLGENDKVTIKGFETVKRNYAPISKEVQETVLGIVLREQDAKKAFSFVRQKIEDLKSHKVPVDEVIIKTQLTKSIDSYQAIGPHVAAAIRMKDKGKSVKAGMMIRYVVTEGKGRIRDRARLPDEIDCDDYDAEYYISHQILPMIEKIFEVLGYSKEQLEEGQKQSTLGGFM